MKNSLHAGVSLIIAIVFVSALLLVMAGLFEIRIRVIQAVGNRETEAKAQYLAESAVELASFWAATHGVGRNTTDADAAMDLTPLISAANNLGISCDDIDGNATNGSQPCVGVEVVNRPADAAQKVTLGATTYFSAPIRGSGDAAGESDCSSRPADADDPCNWNRLAVGQTVEIPLYYENSDGTVTKLNFGTGGPPEEFKLRVKTPGNIMLYPSVTAATGGENPDYRNPDRDPVLVQWSIFDEGGSGVITAWDKPDAENKRLMSGYRERNTEVSSGRINLARPDISLGADVDPLNNFIVLQYLNSGGDDDKHYGKKTDKSKQLIGNAISTDTSGYTKPTLRLTLVGQPQRSDSDDVNDRSFDVPYLEYQVLTKTTPMSDSKSLIIGRAEIGGFRKEFRKYLKRQTSASGFAIESF